MSDSHDESTRRILGKLRKELGKTVREALEASNVIEVILNDDGKIWIDRMGVGMEDSGETMPPVMAEAMLGTVATVLHTEVNREKPLLQGELPLDGSRIQGILPPIVQAPIFAIRKRASTVFPLSAYVTQGRMTEGQKEVIQKGILERKNILICGGTGSGKTTLGNAILNDLAEQCPSDRALILEDTVELQCPLKNKTRLKTCPEVEVTMRILLWATMRLRPDRIIVGEVRGGEALELLKAWNTGHPGGFCTIHANDALGALIRMEQLIMETGAPSMREFVGEAVDIVIFIERAGQIGPKVQSITEVKGVEKGGYLIKEIA